MRCLIQLSAARVAFFILVLAPWLCGCGPRKIEHGLEFVIAVRTNQVSQVSSNDVQQVVEVFQNRIATIGCPWSVEAAGGHRVSVKIDPESKEQVESARFLLTRIGRVDFRLVHQESEKLARDGIVPPGHEMLNELRAAPGGQRTLVPQIVSKEATPELAGAKFLRVSMSRGAMNQPEILFEFDPAGALAFERVTKENVGRQLAIILDRQILSAPRIASPIPGGRGSISGGFDDAETLSLITILKYPLEIPATMVEERRF